MCDSVEHIPPTVNLIYIRNEGYLSIVLIQLEQNLISVVISHITLIKVACAEALVSDYLGNQFEKVVVDEVVR